METISYVTFDRATRALTGSYLQIPAPDQADRIEVSDDVRNNWTLYRMNATLDGVELLPPVVPDIDALKAAKNDEINAWRAAANFSTFPYADKYIACDTLSRSDIDGVANNITLSGGFPDGFPMAWKATDNSYIQLADVAAFKAMYSAMTAQGTANFNHAQQLKTALAQATTAEEVAAIVW